VKPPAESARTRLSRILARAEDGLLALLLTLMVLLAAGQILARNLFGTGLVWGEPLLRLLVLWITLLGALAATRDGHHIRIDALSRFLGPTARGRVRRLTDGFAAGVCGLLAWHGGRLVQMEWQDGLELFAGVPAWLGELIIPAGFGLMALRLALQALFGPPPDVPPA
jgi:TRAP-type C4-dicarboxylate transport system permease small subunit